MKSLGKYFVNGLIVLVPLVVTLYVVYLVVTKIDGVLSRVIALPFPGLGVVVTFLLITLMGYLASSFLFRKLFIQLLFFRWQQGTTTWLKLHIFKSITINTEHGA